MSDDELVDIFGNACLKAGKSNSGLCINASASSDWQGMQEWRRELKKRFASLREQLAVLHKQGTSPAIPGNG